MYFNLLILLLDFNRQGGSAAKNPPAGDTGSILGLGTPLRNKMTTSPVVLPGKSHGRRILAGYTQGRKESNTTK